jgi:hypothetical protein
LSATFGVFSLATVEQPTAPTLDLAGKRALRSTA